MIKVIEMMKPVNEIIYTMKNQRLILIVDFKFKPTAPAVRRTLNFVFTLENKRWSIFRKTPGFDKDHHDLNIIVTI